MSMNITDQFNCCDEHGNQYTVFETTISNINVTASGSKIKTLADKNFHLSSGEKVEKVHEDKWKIEDRDIIIWKV